MVRTHGTLIDEPLARRLKAIDVGIVLVDLWGATAATHDALTGTPGSFERTVAGVRHLVAAGVETHALFILNRRNVHELQAWCDLVGSLAASAAGVLRLYPLGRELRSGRVEGSCSKCSATQGSHGGCRSTAYAFHGRFSAPDPFDLELNHGVDLTSLPR